MSNEPQTAPKEVPETAQEVSPAPPETGGASNGVVVATSAETTSAETASAETASAETAKSAHPAKHREPRGKGQKPSGQNSLQDRFLARLKRHNATVSITLSGSTEPLEGRVLGFDHFCLLLATAKGEALVYKHGITTLVNPGGGSLGTGAGREREQSGKKSRGARNGTRNEKGAHNKRPNNRHDNRPNNRHSAAAHKPATASLREMLNQPTDSPTESTPAGAESSAKNEIEKGHSPPAGAPTVSDRPAGAGENTKGDAPDTKDGGSAQ